MDRRGWGRGRVRERKGIRGGWEEKKNFKNFKKVNLQYIFVQGT